MFRAVPAALNARRTGGRSTHPSAVNSGMTDAGTGTPSVRVVERPATRTCRPITAVTTHHRMQSLPENPVTLSWRCSTCPISITAATVVRAPRSTRVDRRDQATLSAQEQASKGFGPPCFPAVVPPSAWVDPYKPTERGEELPKSPTGRSEFVCVVRGVVPARAYPAGARGGHATAD